MPLYYKTVEKDEESKLYLIELSKYRKSIALPEEVTRFINDDKVEVIGNRPYYCFEDGVMTKENYIRI